MFSSPEATLELKIPVFIKILVLISLFILIKYPVVLVDNLSEIYLSISDNDTNDSILEKINSELTKGFFSLVVIFKNTTKNFNILLKKTNLNKIKGIQIIFQKWNSSGEVTISNLASDNLTSGIGDDFNGASYKGTMVGATLTVKTSSGGVYLIQSAHLFNKS